MFVLLLNGESCFNPNRHIFLGFSNEGPINTGGFERKNNEAREVTFHLFVEIIDMILIAFDQLNVMNQNLRFC